MLHRTMIAALLAGLAASAGAAAFSSPAYDQAAGVSAGKGNLVYDGNFSHSSADFPVSESSASGVRPPAAATASRTARAEAAVPALDDRTASEKDDGPRLPTLKQTEHATIGAAIGGLLAVFAVVALGGTGFGSALAAGCLIGAAIGYLV